MTEIYLIITTSSQISSRLLIYLIITHLITGSPQAEQLGAVRSGSAAEASIISKSLLAAQEQATAAAARCTAAEAAAASANSARDAAESVLETAQEQIGALDLKVAEVGSVRCWVSTVQILLMHTIVSGTTVGVPFQDGCLLLNCMVGAN